VPFTETFQFQLAKTMLITGEYSIFNPAHATDLDMQVAASATDAVQHEDHRTHTESSKIMQARLYSEALKEPRRFNASKPLSIGRFVQLVVCRADWKVFRGVLSRLVRQSNFVFFIGHGNPHGLEGHIDDVELHRFLSLLQSADASRTLHMAFQSCSTSPLAQRLAECMPDVVFLGQRINIQRQRCTTR